MQPSFSEVIAVAALAFFTGVTGLLISRRRKHLRLIVRVVDKSDERMIAFLEDLKDRGELVVLTST